MKETPGDASPLEGEGRREGEESLRPIRRDDIVVGDERGAQLSHVAIAAARNDHEAQPVVATHADLTAGARRRAVGGRQSEGELRVASAGSSVASRDAAEREPLASPSIVQPPRLAAGAEV